MYTKDSEGRFTSIKDSSDLTNESKKSWLESYVICPSTFTIPKGMIGGVFYVRVSSKAQVSDGGGLETQKINLNIFAKENNIYQIGEFFEEVVSGNEKIQKRPVFEKAVKLALDHNAYLVVDSIDRISRNYEFITEVVKNVKVVSKQHGFNTSLEELLKSARIADEERKILCQRTREGMTRTKQMYEDQYQQDLLRLGNRAVKRRLGIPSVSRAPKHISHVRKKESLEDSERYWTTYIVPVAIELDSEGIPNPTRQNLSDRLTEHGYKNKHGQYFSISILYHLIAKLKESKKITSTEALIPRLYKLENVSSKENLRIEIDEEVISLDPVNTFDSISKTSKIKPKKMLNVEFLQQFYTDHAKPIIQCYLQFHGRHPPRSHMINILNERELFRQNGSKWTCTTYETMVKVGEKIRSGEGNTSSIEETDSESER